MAENGFIASTQMVVPAFSALMDAVFWAAAMAGKAPLAAHTLCANLGFCHTKFALLFAGDHFCQVIPPDIAQSMLGIDIVVTAVDIAVLLDYQS